MCCYLWGCKELDTTERLNWTELINTWWHYIIPPATPPRWSHPLMTLVSFLLYWNLHADAPCNSLLSQSLGFLTAHCIYSFRVKSWTDLSLLYFIYHIQIFSRFLTFILKYPEFSVFISSGSTILIFCLDHSTWGPCFNWSLLAFSQFHSQRDSYKILSQTISPHANDPLKTSNDL